MDYSEFLKTAGPLFPMPQPPPGRKKEPAPAPNPAQAPKPPPAPAAPKPPAAAPATQPPVRQSVFRNFGRPDSGSNLSKDPAVANMQKEDRVIGMNGLPKGSATYKESGWFGKTFIDPLVSLWDGTKGAFTIGKTGDDFRRERMERKYTAARAGAAPGGMVLSSQFVNGTPQQRMNLINEHANNMIDKIESMSGRKLSAEERAGLQKEMGMGWYWNRMDAYKQSGKAPTSFQDMVGTGKMPMTDKVLEGLDPAQRQYIYTMSKGASLEEGSMEYTRKVRGLALMSKVAAFNDRFAGGAPDYKADSGLGGRLYNTVADYVSKGGAVGAVIGGVYALGKRLRGASNKADQQQPQSEPEMASGLTAKMRPRKNWYLML